jgi:aminoglycoside phosphotransferase (APT) family kinase protein
MTDQVETVPLPAGDWTPAPERLEEVISVAWLSRALRTAERGARITAVEEVDRLETTASKVRIKVVTEESDGRRRSESLIVKGAFNPDVETLYSTEALRAIYLGTTAHEARFYRDLAGTVPITVAAAPYAGIDSETGHGVVLLEDLVAAGATFPSPLDSRAPGAVAVSVRELAALHARFWGDELGNESWLAPKYPKYAEVLSIEEWDGLLNGPRGEGIPEDVRRAGRIKAGLAALTSRYSSRTKTLIHADAHPGNLFITAAGGIGFTDWQNYEFGHWSMDLSYHLAASLTPEDRRSTEGDLLREYLTSLGSAGIEAPSFDEAWADYRASLIYGYFLWSITRRVYEPITVEMNHRLGTAVTEHESFSLLGV